MKRGRLAAGLVVLTLAVAAYAGSHFLIKPDQAEAARPAKAAIAIPVVTATATREDLPIRATAIGWVEPIAQIAIVSRIDSQIERQFVQEGQEVKAGDLLFKLDDRDLQATLAHDQAMLVKDQASAERAARDEERARKLLSTNAGSQQALDLAVAESRAAAAAVQADQATVDASTVQLSYTDIHAPIDGRLGDIALSPGDFVKGNDASQPLVTVTQMKPVYVTFTLPERSLDRLRAALEKTPDLQARILVGDDPQPRASGSITFLDSTVDRASGTVTVKATVPNDDLALWPGQYVQVELDLGTAAGAAVIPTVALQPGQQGPYVFVVNADSKVEQRPVQVAGSLGDRTAVSAGVTPGEAVVTEGQAQLADGMTVRSSEP